MKRQRPASSLIENPFIKPENKSWELNHPSSLHRTVSPPPSRKAKTPDATETIELASGKSTSAAVESGEVEIEDHVTFFSTKLYGARLPELVGQPRLTHQAWLDLYRGSLDERGHHFVVHQHDHPIAGTHYDLRLQCNATSSISFAIMYGLPGDPNSLRPNRNATETRVHNLWNHLIETASHDTGTMLLWDTGQYSVIPYRSGTSSRSNVNTDSSGSDSDSNPIDIQQQESESHKLHRAFQGRKIKLRLHGTRLPKNYTINLRLTSENARFTQPPPPSFKRRRKNDNKSSTIAQKQRQQDIATSDSSQQPSSQETHDMSPSSASDVQHPAPPTLKSSVSSLRRLASPPPARKQSTVTGTSAVDTLAFKETIKKTTNDVESGNPASTDDQIRLENAYPGAHNSINSIHQRKWFLSLDREASGLAASKDPQTGRRVWRSDGGAFTPFHVLGRAHETSIVTGRKAADVAKDEGLVGYRPRGGWVGITE